jgi:hypothetical protein
MFGEPAQRNRDLPQFIPGFATRQPSGLSQDFRSAF